MKVTVELIAIELPQFGSGKEPRASIWRMGANVADALSGLGVDSDPALLAMVNGEAVPRDHWTRDGAKLGRGHDQPLFRPFKGG